MRLKFRSVRLGDGLDEQRLGKARHARNDGMASDQQGSQHLFDDAVLTDNLLANLFQNPFMGGFSLSESISEDGKLQSSARALERWSMTIVVTDGIGRCRCLSGLCPREQSPLGPSESGLRHSSSLCETRTVALRLPQSLLWSSPTRASSTATPGLVRIQEQSPTQPGLPSWPRFSFQFEQPWRHSSALPLCLAGRAPVTPDTLEARLDDPARRARGRRVLGVTQNQTGKRTWPFPKPGGLPAASSVSLSQSASCFRESKSLSFIAVSACNSAAASGKRPCSL